MKVLRSTDQGKTFMETKSAPAFPKDDGRALANIWSIEAGGEKKDLWCGVEPIWVFEAPIAVRNSVAIWCRKLQGSPSPKYVVPVHSNVRRERDGTAVI